MANLITLPSKECAKRWQQSLDPRLEHRGWTVEEVRLNTYLPIQRYSRMTPSRRMSGS